MKNISKTYEVAGHTFVLTLPESEKLWKAIGGQYEPFRREECANPLFTLEYADSLPSGERVCVYDMPTEPGETVVRLYRQGGGWIFETHINNESPLCATVWATEDFSHALLRLETRRLSDAVFGVNNAAMLLYAFSTAGLGTLEFHASVIKKDGLSYLFLGKSGTGKSTHSSLWLKNIPGAELMNDDNPIVRAFDDGSVVAYGSPWSGKTPCYKNIQAPIGAFVQIRQAPVNAIERQSVLEAYSSLYSSVSGFKEDTSEMSDGLNDTLDKVISNVPCYVLDCLPDADAAFVCAKEVGALNRLPGYEEGRNAMEVILHRTSIRHFTSEPVSKDDILAMLRAGMAAPSAMNFQPWSFVVVTDRARLEEMSGMNPHGKMLASAPLAIAVCGTVDWTRDSETSENPYWQQDCSAVTQNILLAADYLGLGAVWTGCYPRMERAEAYKAFLGVPDGCQVMSIIVIGHIAPNSKGEISKPKDKWDPDKIHWGKW